MAQRWQRVTASSSRNLAAPAPALQLSLLPALYPLLHCSCTFVVQLSRRAWSTLPVCAVQAGSRVPKSPSSANSERERERERDFPTWVHRGLSATSGAPPYLSTIGSGSFSAPLLFKLRSLRYHTPRLCRIAVFLPSFYQRSLWLQLSPTRRVRKFIF